MIGLVVCLCAGFVLGFGVGLWAGLWTCGQRLRKKK